MIESDQRDIGAGGINSSFIDGIDDRGNYAERVVVYVLQQRLQPPLGHLHIRIQKHQDRSLSLRDRRRKRLREKGERTRESESDSQIERRERQRGEKGECKASDEEESCSYLGSASHTRSSDTKRLGVVDDVDSWVMLQGILHRE